MQKSGSNFFKYEATGNDFILVEGEIERERIASLCHRRYGVGADGVICLLPSKIASVKMVYYNSDGSRANLCLNGARVVATHLEEKCTIETDSGLYEGDKETIFAPMPTCLQKTVVLEDIGQKGSFYFAGVPHFVLEADLSLLDLSLVGKQIREHPLFQKERMVKLYGNEKSKILSSPVGTELFPSEGTNVNFYEKVGKNHWQCRTYERGVEGETLSCGSGALCCFSHMGEKEGVITFKSGNALSFCCVNDQVKVEGRVSLVFYGTIPFSLI